jgi:hypothetical protein
MTRYASGCPGLQRIDPLDVPALDALAQAPADARA